MSDPTPISLDEMERDALTELINMGVSRAAASLCTMIKHEVQLSVPSVAIISRGDAARTIGEPSSARLVVVRQTFEGEFSGRAMLIVPEANSLELARAVIGDASTVKESQVLEQEALAETGNVVLNSCLSTIANVLMRSLQMSLPETVRGTAAELFAQSAGPGSDEVVLLICINFSVNARDIGGYIAMVMDLPALRALKSVLAELIRRMAEPVQSASHVAR